jgi:hypothetical protein
LTLAARAESPAAKLVAITVRTGVGAVKSGSVPYTFEGTTTAPFATSSPRLAGPAQVKVCVITVADTAHEGPETVSLSIQPDPA